MLKEVQSQAIANWDSNNPILASVVNTSDPTKNAVVVSNNDWSNILGSMNIWLYMYSSQLPATWKTGQYAALLETWTYWVWDGTAWENTNITFDNSELQSLLKIINPLHRINFNGLDQLKVATDTNSSLLSYNWSNPSPNNADFQYNLPVQSKTPRLIDRQWFIF